MSNGSGSSFPEPEILARFPKNSVEEVRVCLSEYQGSFLIDTRVYYKDSSPEGYKPSKKGVSIRYSKLPALLQALEKARAVLIERGLLEPNNGDDVT